MLYRRGIIGFIRIQPRKNDQRALAFFGLKTLKSGQIPNSDKINVSSLFYTPLQPHSLQAKKLLKIKPEILDCPPCIYFLYGPYLENPCTCMVFFLQDTLAAKEWAPCDPSSCVIGKKTFFREKSFSWIQEKIPTLNRPFHEKPTFQNGKSPLLKSPNLRLIKNFSQGGYFPISTIFWRAIKTCRKMKGKCGKGIL